MSYTWWSLVVLFAPFVLERATTYPDRSIIWAPGNFGLQTPQMIVFTYSGRLYEQERKALDSIFLATYKNKNNCRIGITAFVINEESIMCSVNRLYSRGHEIALSGTKRVNRVDIWNNENWNDSISLQRKTITNETFIKEGDLVGLRAQEFFPGNASQFEMANENGLVYDSSLLIEPYGNNLNNAVFVWPFIMKREILNSIKCRGGCPNDTFPGLWEVPVSRLYDTWREGLSCAYLDQCISGHRSSGEVKDLLRQHLDHLRANKRAPLHINLRPRILESPQAGSGIREFIEYALSLDDVWIVTLGQLVDWMKTPTPNNLLVPVGLWDCPKRILVKCSEKIANKTVVRVTFERIIDVEHLWIWQTAFLFVTYIVIYRYDKHSKKKD